MSSPNEPGQPGPGDGPATGNGSVERGEARPAPAAAPPSGDVPPWQRGAARARTGATPPRPAETPVRPEARPAAAAPAGSSIEARVSRFITGTAAPDLSGAAPAAQRKEPEVPARPAEPRPERADVARTEVARTEVARTDAAYASELPDLSGPKPPQPRKAAAEAPNRPAPVTPRVQVANRSGGPVRATMQIRHIDPWSALKVSLLLSVALFFVWMIAVAFLYLVLGGMGVWSKLNSNVGDLLTSTSGGGGELVSSGTIFGGAALIGLVNIVLLTAMATIGTFIYNLSTDIVGGIEVTLADRD
ncbi:MAG: DUF3566 domain-containing protein [Mycobacterium sp.]|nr:DUF3566 domain-containing protein [Mycobacterium sp.]